MRGDRDRLLDMIEMCDGSSVVVTTTDSFPRPHLGADSAKDIQNRRCIDVEMTSDASKRPPGWGPLVRRSDALPVQLAADSDVGEV